MPARRTAPPFQLWTQAPQPEQPWIARGGYGDARSAKEDATFYVREPGTVVRITQGPRLSWLGLLDAGGALRRAPPLPVEFPAPYRDWVEAWEGPRAEADWMLRSCDRVDRRWLVLAACACVRTGLPRVPPWPERDADELRALDAAEAWTRGELAVGEVMGALEVPIVSVHVAWAASAAWRLRPSELAAEAARTSAHLLAASDDEADRVVARRSLAPLVRRFISLGTVLLSGP